MSKNAKIGVYYRYNGSTLKFQPATWSRNANSYDDSIGIWTFKTPTVSGTSDKYEAFTYVSYYDYYVTPPRYIKGYDYNHNRYFNF